MVSSGHVQQSTLKLYKVEHLFIFEKCCYCFIKSCSVALGFNYSAFPTYVIHTFGILIVLQTSGTLYCTLCLIYDCYCPNIPSTPPCLQALIQPLEFILLFV